MAIVSRRRLPVLIGLGALIVVVLVAGEIVLRSRPIDQLPYEQTLTGSSQTPWIELAAGWYNFEVRQDSAGCSVGVTLVDQRGRAVLYLEPIVIGFGGGKIVGPTDWYGQTGPMPGGQYQFSGSGGSSCRWSVRITRFTRTQPASAAR